MEAKFKSPREAWRDLMENPKLYDPRTEVVWAVVHGPYAYDASGELFYNLST